jgi:hypothetical protein
MRAARTLLAVLGMVAIGAATPVAAQTAPPSPLPLPEIGRTHSKGLCTTVRDRVAPAVLGLMKTDELIAAGHRALIKSGQDQIQPSAPTGVDRSPKAALDLDRAYLERVVQAMAHNLQLIKRVLDDPKAFPKNAATDDDRYALLLKAQIQDAANRQNDTLNRINGVLESQGMNAMRQDISTGMQSSTGPTNSMGSPGAGFFDTLSLPGSGPSPLNGISAVPPSNTAGHTIWDELARDVEIEQTRVAHAEQTLTPTVVAVAAGCRDELASPAPSANP